MTLQSVQNVPPPWLPGALEGVWLLLARSPVLLALSIAAVGVVLALLARAFVLFWGGKLTKRIHGQSDDALLRLGGSVVALVILYVSLVAAIQALPLTEQATSIVTRVVVSLLVLQLMRVAFRASALVLRVLGSFHGRWTIIEERTIPLFDLVTTLLVVAITGWVLLEVWDFDPAPWLASAGIVGIAVGFAAKDTLANLFAGFFIIADAPYKVGDYVVLDTGERGAITRVGIRSTRMQTQDDIEVIVPNALMANQKIVNESGGRWVKHRVGVRVGVAYGSDVDRVVEVLTNVARGYDKVAQEPEPQVRMRAFGDSSLDFEVRCWIHHPSERATVLHELHMAVYKALVREKIEIPFPQRDVWVKQLPEAAP